MLSFKNKSCNIELTFKNIGIFLQLKCKVCVRGAPTTFKAIASPFNDNLSLQKK